MKYLILFFVVGIFVLPANAHGLPQYQQYAIPDSAEIYSDPYVFIPIEKVPYTDLSELNRKAVYPSKAKNANIQGTVTVRCLVEKDGKIAKIFIETPVHPLLDSAAVEALKDTRFTPAISNRKPVACWVSIPIIFSLGKETILPKNKQNPSEIDARIDSLLKSKK